MALGSSIYKLTFDTNAEKSLKPTRREMSLLKQVMMETRPPADSYNESVAALGRVFAKSEMTTKQYQHAMRALDAERPEAIALAKQEADAEAKKAEQMKRGEAATRSVETATERYERKVAGLKAALDRENITEQTHARLIAQVTAEYAKTLPPTHELNAARTKAVRLAEQIASAEKKRSESFQRGIAMTRSMATATERYQRELADVERQIRRGGPHVDAYRRRLHQLKTEFALSQQRASGFSKALGMFSRVAGPVAALTGVAVGVGGIGMAARSAFTSYSEFATNMTRSTAIMGDQSAETLEQMRSVARDVSFEVEASAAQAAEGFFFLASAGLSAEESIKALPITAKFAQAGNFDLATATDLLTDAQSALGMNVGTTSQKMAAMTKVGDVLTKANTIANASVEQFSESLTNKAGASLKMLNKDIEEGVAVLAVFADQGLKGEEAGTALSIVLRDMTTQAIANADAWKKHGVAVYDDSGRMLGMAEIIRGLEGKLDGLSDKAKKEFLIELGFSDKSIAFTQMLLGTSDKIDYYKEQLRSAGGTMDDVAGKSMTEMTKVLNTVKAGWDEFSEAVAKPILSGFLGTDGASLKDSIRDFNTQMQLSKPLFEDIGKGIASVGNAAASTAGMIAPLTSSLSSVNAEIERLTGSGLVEFWGNSMAFFAKGGAIGKGLRELGGWLGGLTEVVEPSAKALEKLANAEAAASENAKEAADNLTAVKEALAEDAEIEQAAEKLATSIAGIEQSLQDEISVLLMGADAYERFKFSTGGATDAQLAFYDQLKIQRDAIVEQQKALKESADEEKRAAEEKTKTSEKLKDDIADYTKELEKQIATQGMSADQIKLWEFAQRKVGKPILDTIAALQEEAAAFKEVEQAAGGSFDALLVGSRAAEEALAQARAESQLGSRTKPPAAPVSAAPGGPGVKSVDDVRKELLDMLGKETATGRDGGRDVAKELRDNLARSSEASGAAGRDIAKELRDNLAKAVPQPVAPSQAEERGTKEMRDWLKKIAENTGKVPPPPIEVTL